MAGAAGAAFMSPVKAQQMQRCSPIPPTATNGPREFAQALAKSGKSVTFIRGEGDNHFEYIETLANPYGILGAAALSLMKLSPA